MGPDGRKSDFDAKDIKSIKSTIKAWEGNETEKPDFGLVSVFDGKECRKSPA